MGIIVVYVIKAILIVLLLIIIASKLNGIVVFKTTLLGFILDWWAIAFVAIVAITNQ